MPNRYNIAIDTEFYEDGKGTVKLLSIGMQRQEDRKTLYLVVPNYEDILNNIPEGHFVHEQVAPYLFEEAPTINFRHMTIDMENKQKIFRETIKEFIGVKQQFIGYCTAYDIVAFKSIFGDFDNIPSTLPYTFKDLAFFIPLVGKVKKDFAPVSNYGNLHNALTDAKWALGVYEEIYRNNFNIRSIMDIDWR
jgi:hypothetical protein